MPTSHDSLKKWMFEERSPDITTQPPSSIIVDPGRPSLSASFCVKIWFLPSKNALSRPARIDSSDNLQPDAQK